MPDFHKNGQECLERCLPPEQVTRLCAQQNTLSQDLNQLVPFPSEVKSKLLTAHTYNVILLRIWTDLIFTTKRSILHFRGR